MHAVGLLPFLVILSFDEKLEHLPVHITNAAARTPSDQQKTVNTDSNSS